MQKTHKSLPVFSLHSTHSFKVFQKNYPKHVHKLDIDCHVGRYLGTELTKKILIRLIKLTKKSSSSSSKFKAIQDINLSKFLTARTSQALYVIKRFHRVQSLGLFWDFREKKISDETRRWLKHTNTLQSLSFRQAVLIDGARKLIQTGKLNVKLARDINRRKRIKKITHSFPPSEFHIRDDCILNMNNYPSTIQEMSLDLSKCYLLTAFRKPMSQLFSMKKFFMLTKLEFLVPFETETIWLILRTIPNPQLLTSLGLYLKNNSSKGDEKDLTPIFDFIVECQELEKLDLLMTHPTKKLNRLSCKFKLKILNLWVSVTTDKHLQDLGAVIKNASNLENLSVTVEIRPESLLKKTFSGFYKGISQLTKLKKLHLQIYGKRDVPMRPVYSELMNCLEGLSQLEEFSLDGFYKNLHLEFPSVLEGLSKIAPRLKKFSMDFIENYFEQKDELGLIELLEKMIGLRELKIQRFSFKHSLLKFKQVLEGYKHLKKIVWKDFESPKEGSEVFFEMMKVILAKKGIEEVRFIDHQKVAFGEKRKEILFEEIVERNPALRVVEIRSEIFSNNWYHSPFVVYKYT